MPLFPNFILYIQISVPCLAGLPPPLYPDLLKMLIHSITNTNSWYIYIHAPASSVILALSMTVKYKLYQPRKQIKNKMYQRPWPWCWLRQRPAPGSGVLRNGRLHCSGSFRSPLRKRSPLQRSTCTGHSPPNVTLLVSILICFRWAETCRGRWAGVEPKLRSRPRRRPCNRFIFVLTYSS